MDKLIRKIAVFTAAASLVFVIGSAKADDTDVYMKCSFFLP